MQIETLGWQPFFAHQTSATEMGETPPVRIVEVHRNAAHIIGNDIDEMIPAILDTTVGDWVLLNCADPQLTRVLDRKSLMKRHAPGTDRQIQLIAANIDTAFIVSSCNQDFNVARLERYIALTLESEITPVIVLTKADLDEDIQTYIDEAQSISELVTVIALDARGAEPTQKLAKWCEQGQTVAFVGSSGVGKSTLTNALIGSHAAQTQSIREDDAKGRHTTTTRQLHMVPGGCMVMDTPGMRSLQMTDASSGLSDLFGDLHDLSQQCKFRDCKHTVEPGCAIQKAVKKGDIDTIRLARWHKLTAEDTFNTTNFAQRKSKNKTLSKTIRKSQNKK
jgi:ribosome biogenesis GTPase